MTTSNLDFQSEITIAPLNSSQFHHTPFYCEENVYLLCKKLCASGVADVEGSDLFVVFISNERKQVPLWHQKASQRADGVVLWDYHVICIQRKKGDSSPLVWDLDSSLPFPSPLASYVSETIRPSFQLFSEFQSPPSHAVFQNLIPLLLTVVGSTYIGKTLSPMETHHASVWAFLFATVIYWSTLGLMFARTFDGETCYQILSYVLFISGMFSCASLFSILLPNLLGQFVLHASLPLILVVAVLFYFRKRIKIAIGDNLNSQTIANSFDWVLNKFNSARGWVQDNLNSQKIANSFDWLRNKFNSARGLVQDNFNSQTIANSFDWVRNKLNSARGWVQKMQQHPSSLPTTSSSV